MLVPLPSCQCVTSREYVQIVDKQWLFQFLMGLNDDYQAVRS